MNRLETRVKRLEDTDMVGGGVNPQLFGVDRIYVDQFGNEMTRKFFIGPELPPPFVAPDPPESELEDLEVPMVSSCRDELWLMSVQDFIDVLKDISGQTRTI